MKLKVCGIKTTEIFQLLLERNIDYIGLIRATSKRQVSYEKLLEFTAIVNKHNKLIANKKFVAVFLDPTMDDIEKSMEAFPFDAIQLHGQEIIGFCKKVNKKFPQLEIIKTLPVPEHVVDEGLLQQDLQRFISYYKQASKVFLLDTKTKKQSGGTGKSFPWDCVAPIISNKFRNYQIGMAGGLNATNIAELLKTITPDFIDINSGVELDGEKQIDLIDDVINLLEDYPNGQ